MSNNDNEQNEEETKRSCVTISKDLDHRLKTYIPWGQQEQLLRALLEILAETCEEKDSNIVIYHMLAGRAKIVCPD